MKTRVSLNYFVSYCRSRHEYKHTKFKIFLSIMMVIRIAQHEKFMKKLRNTKAELKKSATYTKNRVIF